MEKTIVALSLKRYLIRVFYCILFTFGTMAFIVPRLDLTLFLDAAYQQRFAEYGISGGFSSAVQMTLTGVIMPFAVGLMSIGWAIEDVGLMHYRIQDNRKGKEPYEIEPTYLKYASYLKGFAGITSLIYLIDIYLAFTSINQPEPSIYMDIFTNIILPFSFFFLLYPAYFLYVKKGTNVKSLRKNLKPLKQINKKDILEEKI